MQIPNSLASKVAMVSMAFGILGLGACLCCKDVDPKMTNKASIKSFSLALSVAALIIRL